MVVFIFLKHDGLCGWAIHSYQFWLVHSIVDNFHNSWPSQELIKSSLRAVLTLLWKICGYANTYVGLILKLCWYNLFINPADLFEDIFPISKDKWEPVFRLTKRYLVYGWPTKSANVKTNKTNKSVQSSKGASMTTPWTRGGNQAKGRKKKNIMTDSTYFHTDKSTL